ncbi:MAG: VCBS domain-containing protein, partial [Pseudomonadota bacterium]
GESVLDALEIADPAGITVGEGEAASGSLDWSYKLSNELAQVLGEGEEISLTYVVQVEDNFGGTASQPLTIVIKGTNDKPVAQEVTGMVMEDNSAGIMIDPDFSDIDKNDSFTITVDEITGVTKGLIGVDGGKITYSPNGQFENLPEGITTTDTFEYTVTDSAGASHTKKVIVTIKGQNDDASIGGQDEGMVIEAGDSQISDSDHTQTEVGDPTAEGQLTISDVDDGEDVFKPASNQDLQGDYGTFTFDELTGEWTYELNDDKGAVQRLNVGDELVDKLTVESLDGTAQETIEVTIKGTNDNPIVTKPAPHLEVTEFSEGSYFETWGTHIATGHIGLRDVDSDFGLREDRNKWPDAGFPDVREVVSVKKVDFDFYPANDDAPPVDTTLLASLFVFDYDFGEFDSSIAKLNYAFKVKDGEIEFLGHGDKLDITYHLKIKDTDGGFVETPVKLTIVGSNDKIEAEVSSPAAEVYEDLDAGMQEVSTSGQLEIKDIDMGDDVTITNGDATAMLMDKNGDPITDQDIPATLLNAMNLSFNGGDPIMTNGSPFNVDFDYNAAAADLDFLAHGDELTLKYQIQVSDGKVTDTETIEILIKGTNDQPQLAGVHVFEDLIQNGSFED